MIQEIADMSTLYIILTLAIIYLFYKLWEAGNIADHHNVRLTIMRTKLMQQDFEYGREIKDYSKLV